MQGGEPKGVMCPHFEQRTPAMTYPRQSGVPKPRMNDTVFSQKPCYMSCPLTQFENSARLAPTFSGCQILT